MRRGVWLLLCRDPVAVSELYSLDLRSSYEHAFVYLRQLAIHLRNAMTLKSKAASVHVYNMQFLSCLRGAVTDLFKRNSAALQCGRWCWWLV